MRSTPRAFLTMSIAVLFVVGISGCGKKSLSVSTSSAKANEEEALAASLEDTPSEQTGIQDSSLTESGLGSESASQDQDSQKAADQEVAMLVEPPPAPTIRNESEEDPLENLDPAIGPASAETDEEFPLDQNSGAEEEIPNPSAYPTSMDSDLEPGLEASASNNGAPLAAIDSTENDQGNQFNGGSPNGGSPEEEFGALMDSPHVERVPENIVVAKVESSDAVEEQLARIKEDELATAAAGLQDIYFEFDSWKITAEGKEVLEQNANLLEEDSDMSLLIEGHCDQRGTQAYNIVLGKKRAIAIRDYLVALGVEPTRLSVVTYGKEKPFCTDATEFCYRENRRGHLIVQ